MKSSDYENIVVIHYSRYKRVAKNKIPLTINAPEDVSALLERFGRLMPRSTRK